MTFLYFCAYMNIESRRGCKDLITILEKSVISFYNICVDQFLSHWVLNKYMRLFFGFLTVVIASFHLVIKLESIE